MADPFSAHARDGDELTVDELEDVAGGVEGGNTNCSAGCSNSNCVAACGPLNQTP
ncbi:hypothetical protein [Longimicrobium sp.]|uniref:hypothetical protein n=1 Tax=Longimicrobium sp. TaxID=2029185 RepID=UPI002CEF33EF|nr:hypothetical protein [Longimicrobium sp.]HSU14678.1 hypothetical protein [Longimicrobium sp.]